MEPKITVDRIAKEWQERVSTEWAAQLWCFPETGHLEMDVDFANHIAKKMRPYLIPYALLEGHYRPRLLEVAAQLKQADGESWAVGAALEQICLTLDFHRDKGCEPCQN